jgi:hypothetical protein
LLVWRRRQKHKEERFSASLTPDTEGLGENILAFFCRMKGILILVGVMMRRK